MTWDLKLDMANICLPSMFLVRAPSPYLVGGSHFGRLDVVPHELLGGGSHLLGALSNGILPAQGNNRGHSEHLLEFRATTQLLLPCMELLS